MAKKKTGLLGLVFNLLAWTLVLSSFGVTFSEVISFGWFSQVGELLVNFFTN